MRINKTQSEKKMNKFLLILILTIICSCANSGLSFRKKYKGIHPKFTHYVEEFIKESKGKITKNDLKSISMGFKTYPANVGAVGTCNLLTGEIDVSKEWWNSYYRSYAEKYELIFHELGHCVLYRGHTQIKYSKGFIGWLEKLLFELGIFENKAHLKDGCPSSFMHPYVLDSFCTIKHFNYYMRELFSYKNKNDVFDSEYKFEKFKQKQRCPEAKVVNKTKVWNEQDVASLKNAHKKCIDLYNTCLKKFIKKEARNYHAICQ
jgi:hypothetical protein